jgi:glycosyltransferase involved in cell wall biosynthesis
MARDFSPKPLRILHLAKWYPNHADVQNGVFIQKHILATTQFAEVKVLAWLPGKAKTETRESHENGLAVTRTWFKEKTPISAKRHAFREYINSHYNNKQLPDIIHLHVFSPDLLVAVFWAKKKKIPVVISEHWSGYMRRMFERMPYWRKWAYKRLGKVERILPVSAYLEENMRRCGIRGKYVVIPNVVEANEYAAKRTAHFSFVMVADLADDVKNISGVLQAFNQVAAKSPGIELHIIGGGPDEEALKKMAGELENSQYIHFHGRLANSEVKHLLPQYHCLIVNSRVESFGVVLLEAHAAGLPVITTQCGGPEEWVEEGDLIIPKDDGAALKNAMLEMIEVKKEVQFDKWKACLPENISHELQQVYAQVFHEYPRKQEGRKKKV